jgi:hypothetical protein
MSRRGPWSDKVTALLAQFPGPVTFHPSKLKWIAFAIPLAIGDGFIIHVLWSTLPRLSGKALAMVGGFLVVPILLLIFLAAVTYRQDISLDVEGFEFHLAFGRVYRIRWSAIARFGSFLFWAFHLDTRPPSGRWDRFQRAYLAGDYIFWMDTFGLGAKGFARLMNAWRERALDGRDNS